MKLKLFASVCLAAGLAVGLAGCGDKAEAGVFPLFLNIF